MIGNDNMRARDAMVIFFIVYLLLFGILLKVKNIHIKFHAKLLKVIIPKTCLNIVETEIDNLCSMLPRLSKRKKCGREWDQALIND